MYHSRASIFVPVESSQDTDIRSFTPPPSALSELNSHSVEQTGDSQSQSENTESSAPGVTSSVATEGEGEKMAEEKDGEGKAEGKEEKGKGEGLTPLKITSNLEVSTCIYMYVYTHVTGYFLKCHLFSLILYTIHVQSQTLLVHMESLLWINV